MRAGACAHARIHSAWKPDVTFTSLPLLLLGVTALARLPMASMQWDPHTSALPSSGDVRARSRIQLLCGCRDAKLIPMLERQAPFQLLKTVFKSSRTRREEWAERSAPACWRAFSVCSHTFLTYFLLVLGRKEKLMRCSQCQIAKYCSAKCQVRLLSCPVSFKPSACALVLHYTCGSISSFLSSFLKTKRKQWFLS